ncbi:MAG: hypothetical protein U9M95_06720 [Candidatus Altiarchaeota archaeon]|nr:hypothetical protein [Candidatus Altiarchaeota archaeon]
MILLDTDIASALAKAGGLDLALELFNKQVHIIPKVYEELQASVGYGYVFPQELFEKIRVLDVTPEEQRTYRRMLSRHMTLGKGELESVSVALERGCLFSSLDREREVRPEKESQGGGVEGYSERVVEERNLLQKGGERPGG